MATASPKKTVHDWSTGQLVETEVDMTEEEIAQTANNETNAKYPPAEENTPE